MIFEAWTLHFNKRLFERISLTTISGWNNFAAPAICESLLSDDIRVRGSWWDTGCVHRLCLQCVYTRASPYVSQTRQPRSHTDLIAEDPPPPLRDLVRQLLTGLSHPAREKDHLARRADISNDTDARFFEALVWLLLSPHSSTKPGRGTSLVPARPRRQERVGHADALPSSSAPERFGVRVSVILLLLIPPSSPRCFFFARKALPVSGDFSESPLFRRTPKKQLRCVDLCSRFYVPLLEVITRTHRYIRVYPPEDPDDPLNVIVTTSRPRERRSLTWRSDIEIRCRQDFFRHRRDPRGLSTFGNRLLCYAACFLSTSKRASFLHEGQNSLRGPSAKKLEACRATILLTRGANWALSRNKKSLKIILLNQAHEINLGTWNKSIYLIRSKNCHKNFLIVRIVISIINRHG